MYDYFGKILVMLLLDSLARSYKELSSIYNGNIPKKDVEEANRYKIMGVGYRVMNVMEIILIVIMLISEVV